MTENTSIRPGFAAFAMVISRSVENRLGWVLAPLIASGCQFSSGSGGTDGAIGTESTTTRGATSEPETSPPTTMAPTSIAGESSSTDEPTSTDAEPGCEPFARWVWASDVPDEDTTLGKTTSDELPPVDDAPVEFLRALTSGEGTAALPFDLPCSDAVFFFALTWDAADGVENADAYEVGVDLEPEQLSSSGLRWEYGCDSESAPRWDWYQIRNTGPACDPDGPLGPTLRAGEHHLQINNVEPASISGNPEYNFTGLAAIVVTNDPAYDPQAEYDPTPRG